MAMRKVCDVCGKMLIGRNDSFVLTELVDFDIPPVLVDANGPMLKFDACPDCVVKIVGRINDMLVLRD